MVQVNRATAGTASQIRSTASTSASHRVVRVGTVNAVSAQPRIVTAATPWRVWENLAVASAPQIISKAADDLSHAAIRNFPGEPYVVRRPIPITVERVDEADYLARFDAANIASSGSTFQEAYQNLAIEILNIYEKFTNEKKNLGPEPTRQLTILRSYLIRRR